MTLKDSKNQIMESKITNLLIPDDIIMQKIYWVRNQKVMLDRDLADLYGVETKVLKQAVKRNIDRFPDDFMFELTRDEFDSLRSQFGTLKRCEHSKFYRLFLQSKEWQCFRVC